MKLKKDLKHYGVKGMKWGKRIARSADSRSTAKTKRSRIASLSNKQLAAANKRMSLEKNFKRLKQRDYTRAKSILSGILKFVGTATVTTVTVNEARSGFSNSRKAIKLLTG